MLKRFSPDRGARSVNYPEWGPVNWPEQTYAGNRRRLVAQARVNGGPWHFIHSLATTIEETATIVREAVDASLNLDSWGYDDSIRDMLRGSVVTIVNTHATTEFRLIMLVPKESC